MVEFEKIPRELTGLNQWLVWRLEQRSGQDKPTKVPYNARTGSKAQSNNPATWCDFNRAGLAARNGDYDGIGIAFRDGDGLAGVDLDYVIDLETGGIDPRAAEVLDWFQGTYCEVSPSGTGIRIFCFGHPQRCGKNSGKPKWAEVYDHTSPRYLTVTGRHWPGSATTVTDQQAALDRLHAAYFAPLSAPAPAPPIAKQNTTVESLVLSDQELIERALKAKNWTRFRALYDGNMSGYLNDKGEPDHSAADQAFCAMLAFWTARDQPQMDRIFRSSGLMRPKWDERRSADGRTYGQMTLDYAVANCAEVYDAKRGRKRKAALAPKDGSDSAPGGVANRSFEAVDDDSGDGDEDTRPILRLKDGALVDHLDQVDTLLFSDDRPPPFYQRGGTLIRVVYVDRPKLSKHDAVERPTGSPVFAEVSAPWLVETMQRAVRFMRWDRKTKSYLDKDLPDRYAKTYIERQDWRAPVLKALIDAPLLLLSGEIVHQPGYHAGSRTYLDSHERFDVPEGAIEDDDIRWAVELFHDLFDSFAFEEPHDFSAYVAAIITALMRPSLEQCPFFAVRAHAPGSGKTKLAVIVGLIATGRKIGLMAYPKDDENEFRKRLFAAFLAGDPFICIDNVSRPLDSDTLNLIATSSEWRERDLGKSRQISVETNRTVLITGNNLEVVGDLTRRVIPIDLDPRVEKPEERTFEDVIEDVVLARRKDLILACLMIVKRYLDDGSPPYPDTLGSFETWSGCVRNAVRYAGLADPCAGILDWAHTDPVRLNLGRLLAVWRECFGDTAMKASEVIARGMDSLDMAEALEDICMERDRKFNTKRLGRFLSTYVGRIEGGLKLVRTSPADNQKRAIYYKVLPSGKS